MVVKKETTEKAVKAETKATKAPAAKKAAAPKTAAKKEPAKAPAKEAKPAKVETKTEKAPAVKVAKAEKPKAPKADNSNREYATGKRKNAIARVFITPGKGDFMVNGQKMAAYFKRPVLQMLINKPLVLTKQLGLVTINSTVSGGGLSGQAGAICHGISKALVEMDATLRAILKPAGLLTRDSRVVERKKYGHYKARRRFQFTKR